MVYDVLRHGFWFIFHVFQTPVSVEGLTIENTVDPVLEAKYKEKLFTQVWRLFVLVVKYIDYLCYSSEFSWFKTHQWMKETTNLPVTRSSLSQAIFILANLVLDSLSTSTVK